MYALLSNSSFIDLFTGARVRNTMLFFMLHNIYQHQSWKYSYLNIYWR